MPEEQVVLVDEAGREVGTEEKLRVHQDGRLHRAFSIFVFDSQGRTLLQQRALGKYHSGGLWSNTCCSHPRPGEALEDATHRRLVEEMGFDCPLSPLLAFTYRAELDHGFVEHEYDHVFIGRFDGAPSPDPIEVAAWRWAALDELRDDLLRRPQDYTRWLFLCLEDVARPVK